MRVRSQAQRIPVVEGFVWATAALAGRRPRLGPLRAGVAAGRFQHSEWTALLGRFVQDGAVDYHNMVRVRRLVEVYLQRLADTDPETFIDTDDQLAFYLNAFNAIAIHQVLIAYPLATIREQPSALLRSYPVGRRNVSLHTLHGNILRAFGDPRVHLAICNTARGSAAIMPYAYTGATLQTELDAAVRRFLADEARGLRWEAATRTLVVSPILAWFGGDFARPYAMPQASNLLVGWADRRRVLQVLMPWLPPPVQAALSNDPRIKVARFDWSLNDRDSRESARALLA